MTTDPNPWAGCTLVARRPCGCALSVQQADARHFGDRARADFYRAAAREFCEVVVCRPGATLTAFLKCERPELHGGAS